MNHKKKEDFSEKEQGNPPAQEETAKEASQAEPENINTAQATPTDSSVESLQAQLSEKEDLLLRTLAEFDNFRKRTASEKTLIRSDAVADTICQLLPFLDSLERALSASCSDMEYQKGMDMIVGQLSDFLKNLGVVEIEALGREFDPCLHNAVMVAEDDSKPSNTVCEVLQKGYLLKDRVIRHAMVKVIQ